jgi:hypothetical protein
MTFILGEPIFDWPKVFQTTFEMHAQLVKTLNLSEFFLIDIMFYVDPWSEMS